MDKYHALIILIRNSFLLSEKAKIDLLEKVPQLTLKKVEELGLFLVYERDFFEKNQKKIEKNLTLLT